LRALLQLSYLAGPFRPARRSVDGNVVIRRLRSPIGVRKRQTRRFAAKHEI
jgi:hypothetical protein